MAIAHATTILGWFEHLSEEDMPPEWMWHIGHELERHFDHVKERRKSGARDDDDDQPAGPMIQNEYARGRGRAVAVHG